MSFIGDLFKGGNSWTPEQAQIQDFSKNAATANLAGQQQEQLAQQQAFANAVGAQNGIGNQQQVFQQQQGLANQLQGVANGTGPNPALAQLNQATGQNVANQAALMAGQRGANANVGLLARQAANQGANIQQNAAGQAATLQAQQQLGAMGQLAGQQANMGNLAQSQVNQQANALQGLNQLGQGEQALQYGALGQLNNANVANVSQANQAQSGVQQGKQQSQQGLLGGVGNAVMGIAGLALADGGVVPSQQQPQMQVTQQTPIKTNPAQAMNQGQAQPTQQQPMTPGAQFGDTMSKLGSTIGSTIGKAMPGGHGVLGMIGQLGSLFGGGDSSGPKATPEQFPSSQQMDATAQAAGAFAKGGNVGAKLKAGGHVPGKAKVSGDSLKNDTVDAKLSPGEVVLPRSVVQSEDPAGNAARFVQAIMARQGMRK